MVRRGCGIAVFWLALTTVRCSSSGSLEPFRPANVLKLSPSGAGFQEQVNHSPAFGTLHVKLGPGAKLKAEAGAMVCMQVCSSFTVYGVDG